MNKLSRQSARYAKMVTNNQGEVFNFEYYGFIEEVSFLHTKRLHLLTNITSGEQIKLTSYQLNRKDYTITERAFEPLMDDLWELAYRAYLGTSFSPEDRQERVIREHEMELMQDIEDMPEEYRAEYASKYKEMFSSWLTAQSRCTSTMITGGANYNVRRHDKVHGWERNASDKFREWRIAKLKTIEKKAEQDRRNNLSDTERFSEDFKPVKAEIVETFDCPATWKKALLYGFLERRALKGEVEMMELAIEFLTEEGERRGQIFTQRHKIWKIVDLAVAAREKLNDRKLEESTSEDLGVCRVVRNNEVDRLQLLFDGKPSPDIISLLKHNGYRWSPRFSAWQRQLTINATSSLDRLLKAINELSI